ncbi:MAG: hypothetical protein AAF600_03375 [Bacteroidota bacterium]
MNVYTIKTIRNLIFLRETLLISAFIFMAACSSTSIISSWKDPDMGVDPDTFKKVLVVVLGPTEASRRIAEDRISSRNEILYPSYNYFKHEEVAKNLDSAKQVVRNENFDGVLFLRLQAVEKDVNYVPGSSNYYRTYWPHHAAYWGRYYEPGYYKVDTNYIIETSAFSVEKDMLLWTSISETVNPSDIEKSVDDIMKQVYKRMIKDGFISE